MPVVRGLHGGQNFYSGLQKAYSREWRKLSKQEKDRFGGYNNYRKSSEGQRVKVQYIREYHAGVGHSPTYTEPDNGAGGSRNQEPTSSPEEFDTADLDQLLEFLDHPATGSDRMADIQNNVPNPEQAGGVAQSSGAEPMDTSSAVGAGTGPGSGMGARAGNGANAGLTTIIPNPSIKSGHITYKKTWYKYTYGLAHTMISGEAVNRYCTPYAYYPVDWLPFYLSPNEYNSLPADCKIKKVSAVFYVMGTRTAFDHGGTLSGTATTEYVPIVKHCIGLNNKIYLENRSVKLKATEPMVVESFNEKSLQDYYESMYHPGGAMEIPRHLNWYANILMNKTSTPGYDGADKYTNYRLDKVLTTTYINKRLGEPLCSYQYEPYNGYVTHCKKSFLIQYNDKDGFAEDVTNKNIMYRHQVPHTLKVTTGPNGAINLSQSLNDTAYSYISRIPHNYFQSVEGYTYINPHKGEHGTFRNQPQVHIGLLATPSLNPGTETANFLNSSIYTVVQAECIVEFDLDSMCVSGDAYHWPEDIRFFIAKARGFTGYGYHNFGQTATVEPRLESTRAHKKQYDGRECEIVASDGEPESKMANIRRAPSYQGSRNNRKSKQNRTANNPFAKEKRTTTIRGISSNLENITLDELEYAESD